MQELAPSWSLAKVVTAIQALRGVAVDIHAAYLSVSFWKNERILLALRCRECIDDFTFALKSA